LEEIRLQYADKEKCLKEEITNVEKCRNEIIVIRRDHATTCKKYEDDITQIKINFKLSIDKCEASVKSEQDINIKIRAEISDLNCKITEIEAKLTFTIKISEEWETKNRNCDTERTSLRRSIETSKINLSETQGQLTTCVDHNKRIQGDLDKSRNDLEICNNSVTDIRKKYNEGEEVIVRLRGEIKTCQSDRKTSENENASLRCATNKFLSIIETAEEKAYKAILEVKGIFDGNKVALNKFVNVHNIVCKTCAEGAPCEDQAAVAIV